MSVTIESTSFGTIVVDGRKYNHDVIIYVNGEIENRYIDFSGSSHEVSLKEIKKVTKDNPEVVVIGTGQGDILSLTQEAREYLHKNNIQLLESPTPDAIHKFNQLLGSKCALLHVTC